MATWHLDRLFRSATACLTLAAGLIAAAAFLVNAYRENDNVLGIMLVGALLVGLSGIAGSVWTTAFGLILFAAGSVLANPPDVLIAVAGCAGFAALLLIDLSITFRGAPTALRSVWVSAAITFAVVTANAMAFVAVAYLVATRATFAALLLPVAVIGIGYAVRLAAEFHERTISK